MQSISDQLRLWNHLAAATHNNATISPITEHLHEIVIKGTFPGAAKFNVSLTSDGFSYKVNTYEELYPELVLLSGLTYSFEIHSEGNPFAICDPQTAEPLTSTNGHVFVHVSNDGKVTEGIDTNKGWESGTLIWTVPANFDEAMYRSLNQGQNGHIRFVNITKV